MFVTAPPSAAWRNASPMREVIAFDVQLIAYMFMSRLPFVSPRTSPLSGFWSPTDITLR
jgi:hypothetical protein